MSVNLLDLAKSTIGSGALSNLSKSLGANEEVTGKAFDMASSAILGGTHQENIGSARCHGCV